MSRKHSHYFKDVSKLETVDVYRVLQLFGVTDQAIGHAVKKLLVAGGRGAGKDIGRDIQEAIDTLERWKEMGQEDKKEFIGAGVLNSVNVEIPKDVYYVPEADNFYSVLGNIGMGPAFHNEWKCFSQLFPKGRDHAK